MRHAHEVEHVRAAEAALMGRLPAGTLMRRAAAGLAAICAGRLPRVYGARVALLVGSGDNGGDALYAGALLARRGAVVRAVPAGDRVHRDGLAALKGAGGRVATAAAIDDADLVIDGLLGIGGRGALREQGALLAARTARSRAFVVACDVPSGVDAGTGEVAGNAVRADLTVTFGTHKPGLLIDPGASHCGLVELVDIGLGPDLPAPDVMAMQRADVVPPRPSSESDKYRRGVVGVIAGSPGYAGAAVLCTGAAVHGGAGMVRFAAVPPVVDLVLQSWPEAVTTALAARPPEGPAAAFGEVERMGRVQAWVIGPGLGTGPDAEALLAAVLAGDVPVLVDADGLTMLAHRRDLLDRAAPTVLTPHAGELARLLGGEPADGRAREAIERRRLEHVRRAAAELPATVLLKGSTTLIAERGLPVRVNRTGTPRLATAGSGDVLSGLIGALLATGMTAIDAASAGAFLHGLAARGRGMAPISARDIITGLSEAIDRVG